MFVKYNKQRFVPWKVIEIEVNQYTNAFENNKNDTVFTYKREIDYVVNLFNKMPIHSLLFINYN